MPFVVKQDVFQDGILSTLHYKLCNKALLLLLQRMCVGMSIGHIDCCASYYINATKSVDVVLNEDL